MKVAQIPRARADFEIVEREIPEPGIGHVRIKVQACETYPLEKAPEAYARMMGGDAQFRVVLTM